MSPIMSSGETSRVKDFDRVSPTVMRPKQSSVSSVGGIWVEPSIEESCTWLATIATSAVPPAELAIVSTHSVRAY